MAVLSVLRILGSNSLKNIKCAGALSSIVGKPATFSNGALRQMSSHKRVFQVTTSRFVYNKFKDEMHFYLMLGIIPLGLLILYTNIFIGHAELAEIPEGYEPEHWEYHKNPIKRWFAQYVYTNPQQEYEKFMHYKQEEEEMAQVALLEDKIKNLMKQRNDFQAWYYEPVTARYHRQKRRHATEIEEFTPVAMGTIDR